MRPFVGLAGLLLVVAPTVLAQIENAPDLSTVTQPGGDAATNTAETSAAETSQAATSEAATTSQVAIL